MCFFWIFNYSLFKIIFFTLSTINFVFVFSLTSFSIFLYACITVEWSLFPKSIPICGKVILATSLHKYIAICLGLATSFDLLFPAKSFLSILKYFATTSWIKSEDITFSFLDMNSFITFSANSIVIGICVKEALATILLNTPSNSRIFESILAAISASISLSIIILSSWAFFLSIATLVS